MQGLRILTQAIGSPAKVGAAGNFLQVVSAQGILTFKDPKSQQSFFALAGWQGILKQFASLQVTSSVANDVIIVNYGTIAEGKTKDFQEFAVQNEVGAPAAATQVLNDFSGLFAPFQGDGKNLFVHPGEIVASGSFPTGVDTTINFAGSVLDGIQYLLLQADGTITAGDSGNIQGVLKSGNQFNAYMKTVPGNAVVTTWGTTNPQVKINTQGLEAIVIPKGTIAGTNGAFNVIYRAGFFAPLMTF